METRFFEWASLPCGLPEAWERLVSARKSNASLGPRWVHVVVSAQNAAEGVEVASAFSGGRLRAVAPYRETVERRFGWPVRVVEPCSNLTSYHSEIVGDAEAQEQLLRDVLDRAHGGRWDVFRFGGVADDSPTSGIIRMVASKIGATVVELPGERSPYVRIDATWDEFLKGRDKRFRANYSRAIRKMRDAGETGMQWFGRGDDVDELLTYMLAIEEKSWKAQAGTSISRRATERKYYECLLPELSAMGALSANVLHVRGEASAYVLCCQSDGWIGQMKTSFDAGLPDAGARVVDESIKRAFEERAAIYDFLGDAAPHKLKWTDCSRSHTSYWLYSPSLTGRLIASAKGVLSWYRRR